MEFFLGSIFTIILLSIIRLVLSRLNLNVNHRLAVPTYTQSYIYNLVRQRVNKIVYPQTPLKTQSRELLLKNEIRVIFSDKHAYWIRDHKLYQADVVNGQIDDSTKKVVDTMAMDKVELDKMFFIVQKLTEGKNNDSGNSGVGGL